MQQSILNNLPQIDLWKECDMSITLDEQNNQPQPHGPVEGLLDPECFMNDKDACKKLGCPHNPWVFTLFMKVEHF